MRQSVKKIIYKKAKKIANYKYEEESNAFLLTIQKEMMDSSKKNLIEARQTVKETKEQIRDCKMKKKYLKT